MKSKIISGSAVRGSTDWDRLRKMTDQEALQNALDDPDNPPLDETRLARMRRVPRVKIIRRALGLTQEQFSERYSIPLGTLRDWEQGRSEPDQATKAYLKVIANDPDAVLRALHPASAA